MTRDEWMATALILAFATFVTAHVTLVAGMAMRPPRWRALVALFVAPLAPYWGFEERMRWRAALWIAGVIAYGVLRLVSG
jgi:hypothetical protein